MLKIANFALFWRKLKNLEIGLHQTFQSWPGESLGSKNPKLSKAWSTKGEESEEFEKHLPKKVRDKIKNSSNLAGFLAAPICRMGGF